MQPCCLRLAPAAAQTNMLLCWSAQHLPAPQCWTTERAWQKLTGRLFSRCTLPAAVAGGGTLTQLAVWRLPLQHCAFRWHLALAFGSLPSPASIPASASPCTQQEPYSGSSTACQLASTRRVGGAWIRCTQAAQLQAAGTTAAQLPATRVQAQLTFPALSPLPGGLAGCTPCC